MSLESIHQKINTIAGTLLSITMLLLLHRYAGIASDSILYMGQALAQVEPSIFAHDLFFQYGSQSQYSLLPWILGKLLNYIPLPTLFMWGTLCSLLLFAASSWAALSKLFPQQQRYWAWFGVLCLPGIYGTVHIFSYNEAFLTSRPLAESFCLLSIAALIRKRWLLVGVLIFIAGLLHPLQAIAAALIIWPWLVIQNRRWLHALWLTIPILGLAWMGIRPLDGLWRPMDPAWFASVRYSTHIFVSQWGVNDFKTLALDVCLLVLGWRILPLGFARWCLAGLTGLVLGFSASLIFVDGLHWVLPTSLQLWRVQWLAHWLAISGLAALLYQHFKQNDVGRALLLGLVAQLAWGETELGWLAMLGLYLAWPWLVQAPRARLKPLLAWVFGITLVLLFFNHASNEWKWFAATQYRTDLYPIDLRLLIFPALGFGLPLFFIFLWQRTRPTIQIVLSFLALPILCLLAASNWDARKPQDLAFENMANHTAVFGESLPVNAKILWLPENLVASWLILHRASYYSDGQMSGQMFSRDTARHGILRANKIRLLQEASLRCLRDNTTPDLQSLCQIDNQALRIACAPGPVPPPDFIVMPHRQPQGAAGHWDVINPSNGQTALTYYLYSCGSIMKSLDNVTVQPTSH